MRIGVGYRRELASWIATRPPLVQCLEITAEHFIDNGDETLAGLQPDFPVFVHGLSLSLGTPGPLDANRLDAFARVVAAVKPQWVSEHIAFTRAAGIDLGHLNPIRPTCEMLAILADHAKILADRVGLPVLLENITSHVPLTGDFNEPDFLNALCDRAGCALLLDVTNLFVNSRNHHFDPLAWLRQLDPKRIVQLHIVGYSRTGDRYTDSHGEPIQPELIALAQAVLDYAPVHAIILERDEDFPADHDLTGELRKLETLHERN